MALGAGDTREAVERAKCQRKQAFLSELLAQRWLLLLSWKYGGDQGSVYRCRWCPCWHTTSR